MRLHVVAGEPELNAWCARCQLPIRMRIPLRLDGPAATPVGTLEVCPGCGTGHDRPNVAVAPPARPPRRARLLLARWRRNRPALSCAHGSCRRRGRPRHEHRMPGDEGTWRYAFCTRRHKTAWAAEHHILL